MKNKRITMNKLKEVIRLRYQADLSHRQIAASLNLSRGVVAKYLKRAEAEKLSWPLPTDMSDTALSALLQPARKAPEHPTTPAALNFSQIKQELSHPKMTLQLLWEEYAQAHPKNHYSYSRYCVLYKPWLGKQSLSMRQSHQPGEKLFVDYCGPTMPIVNPDTGEIRQAQVFVAVMGASSYTYAEATWTQSIPDWIGSHVRCLEFLGGSPTAIVPDNLKSAVSKACRYDPDLNPTYHQLAVHYDLAVLPARPYKPKDKAKAEVGVQIVERWIMMRLRKQTFHSLSELNQAIRFLLKGR
jgi:transposase